MIAALIKALCISLYRDRMAMLLSFALPCIMFSVFAVIFGGSAGEAKTSKLKVIVLDQDGSRSSLKLIDSLQTMDQLEVSLFQPPFTSEAKVTGKPAEQSQPLTILIILQQQRRLIRFR